MPKIFIDGSAGTTGLRIYERLSERKDLSLMTLPEALRKDPAARKEALNAADIVFLCLPDDAAVEAVGMIENDRTAVIDTSTAHRTADGWVYGFPELFGASGAEAVAHSKRIANPGCHASGFLALAVPLVRAGILDHDSILHCFSITGYSGGGKKMIASYENDSEPEGGSLLYSAPRQYGLSQQHKHLKEMVKIAGLSHAPLFCPIVAPFYSGMEVTVTLSAKEIRGSVSEIAEAYRTAFPKDRGLVRFSEGCDENGFLSAAAFSGRDDMEISVWGCEERILLTARFDNLGKGASGAAIQNMNLLLGCSETAGLVF